MDDKIGHRVLYSGPGTGKTAYIIMRARFLARKYPGARVLVVCNSLGCRAFLARSLRRYRNISVLTLNRLLATDPLIDQYDFALVDESHCFGAERYRHVGNYLRNLAKADLTIVYDRTQRSVEQPSKLVNKS